ncbi:hypothetical protein PAMC26510_37025 [Caballeronia sordidicola]|uniref:Secreted protein n=1 Tax=Caballeronia sordidicola TaxID=196367 RepID=A0A242M424_CABSO|nr:hypothetical protein PAMC26510_37025 [Caballeronia sordidicola]
MLALALVPCLILCCLVPSRAASHAPRRFAHRPEKRVPTRPGPLMQLVCHASLYACSSGLRGVPARSLDRMANGASMCWRVPWIVARVHARSGTKFRFPGRDETPRQGTSWAQPPSAFALGRTNLDHEEFRGTELTMNALLWCARGKTA